ncbi:MAG: hypothetical protein ACRET8_02385 [Burkholderiales bacterium]
MLQQVDRAQEIGTGLGALVDLLFVRKAFGIPKRDRRIAKALANDAFCQLVQIDGKA